MMPTPNTNVSISKWCCTIDIYSIISSFGITHTTNNIVITSLTIIFINSIIITSKFIYVKSISIHTIYTMMICFIFYLKDTNAINRTFTNFNRVISGFIIYGKTTDKLTHLSSRTTISFPFIIIIST